MNTNRNWRVDGLRLPGGVVAERELLEVLVTRCAD